MRAWLLCAALGCGGRVGNDDGRHDEGGATHAGVDGRSGASGTSGGRAGSVGRGGSGAGGEYVDPACPDVAPPPPLVQCDPLASVSGCASGFGCYPFVDHPFGRGCGVATFGAICLEAGTGLQGDPCGDGFSGCAPQHLCVIGSRSGRRCAKICVFAGPEECDAGLICAETDVENYGVCT